MSTGAGTAAGPVTRTDTGTGASWASRAVFWTGIIVATAVAVTALWDGARPRIPGMPPILGLVAGVVLMWLIVAGLGAWAAELLRRHHRALAAHAARHGRRGALAAARVAGNGSRAATGRLAGWAAQRWQSRAGQVTAGTGQPAPAGDLAGHPPAPMPDPRLNDVQRQRDLNGQRNICAACGHPGTPGDPLVLDGGYRIHGSHTVGPAGAPAPAATQQRRERMMTTPAVPSAGTNVAPAKANAPAGWKALAAATADCEPEDDGELLGWMAGEVAGMSAYGEALIAVYETCVDSVGLDPVAMAAVHDVADAAADAATAMAYARQKFASYYAEVREFVGNGGVLPFDGRWLKGEGDT